MSVLTEEMHLTGVKTLNIILFSLIISSMLEAKEIVIHEINRIKNITLINGSSITQGGVTITTDKPLVDRSRNNEKNNSSISQGVVIIEDENITDVHYDIINIIDGQIVKED